MEKEPRRLVFGATSVICLLVLPLLYAEFFALNPVPFDRSRDSLEMVGMAHLSNLSVSISSRKFGKGVEENKSLKSLLRRLVRGEDLTKLEATGFACDSAIHSVVCIANQPVRIDTHTMTVHAPSDQPMVPGRSVVRPYARQDDDNLLKTITPVNILHGNITPPACHYTHNVPAVIFSSSGFTGNLFHEFNEIIIPLFITTRHFKSNVLFILIDYRPWFVSKYHRIFSRLSQYEVMNPAANISVHCFPGAVVGLKYHDNLAINSSEIPGGYSMPDFKEFLRKSYNLKIKKVSEIERPVLVLISRRKTRMFLNEDEMIGMMKELGFQVVVTTRPNRMSNLNRFSKVVNSGSVLVGAHGAGLANELFLSAGAVMVQLMPLGLDWPANAFYGNPAREMGVHYLEYKIEPEESSLLKLYGRDHPVIVDPDSIFAKGYQAGRAVYLDQQNMKINLVRFRETLVEALRLTGRLAPSS
ncbi:unnamed protein product [Ilex paraguariensis]|uniref:Glycosyltransferase 61 catalytic domain-containing protein n=1 Tax=Ilex paraguariensis TaxID=185542 RepID=A0ABC8SJX7_9AQUA